MLHQRLPQALRISAVLFAIGKTAATAADIGAQQPADVQQIAAQHQAVRDLTKRQFDCAVFVSPQRDADAGSRIWMAPLVVSEVAPNASGAASLVWFGAVTRERSAQMSVDTRRLTIYTTSGQIPIGSRQHRQLTYLWFYPPAGPGQPLRWRGFRQTLNRRGFAVIQEALSSESSLRVFVVSKALERAVSRQYGPPLPGRRYSIEPDCQQHADIVVARVAPDGPQPMGPFVYIDRRSLAITTMRCRCEPSQVGRYSRSLFYRLVFLDSFSQLLPDDDRPSPRKLPADFDPLRGVLRLPYTTLKR